MIQLTRINGQEIYINNDLMEFIESTPDTIISLTTGKKLIVKETIEEVIDKIIEFKNKTIKNWDSISKK
ncbi:MAG: flagellar FlbD family protein [Candidatus Cloacimonadales bacterium]|jgi:flagellar protein FlbD|nr:flagellar FlbD family protein [Candidatus Cloacimonadota bacterium]MDD2649524.1 flagellar FlbD family protein [Candidatus Cloacimonadota bacterium]MDD3502103.1 flagellar FlbD family protein [Candidatus Cloacimonadota bacterium]MDX9977790.1 flagellar FlbD family protein [Candidatus Cloacimonadales bacterium]